jgi:hypothetical protein
MTYRELEKLFQDICQIKPLTESLKKLRQYPDRRQVIDFLIDKVGELLEEIRKINKRHGGLERGVIQACFILGEFKAKEASRPMVELLDRAKDDYEAELYNAAMIGLEGMGESALELTYEKYVRDKDNPERASTWLWVLSELGVKDQRIRQALIGHMSVDSDEAVHLIGNYGDRDLLPIVESYVKNIAAYINKNRINPFSKGIRFEDSLVASYIDNRESLVMLRDGIRPDDADFDSRVEQLDRQLLKFADFSVYDTPRETVNELLISRKIGRNDPCPCGSGNKYKRCCGKQ